MLPSSIFSSAAEIGHGTAAETICGALRAAISQEVLLSGQALPQAELAQGFGVSIIPVREALKRLEAEGFVSCLPNRGAMVLGLNEDDIDEYSHIRALLEEQAAAEGARNMTRVELARVEDAYEAFVSGVKESDGAVQSGTLNRAFHNAIYEAAHRPRLFEMIDDLHVRLDRYIRAHLVLEGRKEITDHEHKAILDACRARDPDLCARLTREHILEAAATSIEVMRRRKKMG
ncbi:MAG: GntR family transcriptional regulator [Acetobacter sp.]|uniref:GntR family transcriptional regulator n=1 Tax=Acetobacter sp. TaxID=440 RepID=UPI003D048533